MNILEALNYLTENNYILESALLNPLATKHVGYNYEQNKKAFAINGQDNASFKDPDIKNRYCWHAGGSKYNTKGGSLYKIATSANSIGIEVCSTNSAKKVTTPNDSNWYFTDAVIANTTELVKKLMSDYNIDIDHIIRHYDVNGKPCPGIIGWNEDTGDISKWNDFKYNLIPHEIINDTKPTVEPDKTAVDKVTLTVGEVIDAIEAADREPVIEEPIKKEEPKQEVQATTIKSKGLFDIIIELLMSLFKK